MFLGNTAFGGVVDAGGAICAHAGVNSVDVCLSNGVMWGEESAVAATRVVHEETATRAR